MEGTYYNETNPPLDWQAYGPSTTCTLDLCSVVWSILAYRPSLPANALFLAFFAISLILHIYQGWKNKTWFFAGAIILGCLGEIIGYAGRIIMYYNPFSFNGFIMQIVIITLSPAFFCAAIYVTLSQIINRLCSTCSRFRPQFIYYLFIPCDILSLVLQAAGGGVSSVSIGVNTAGINSTLAGLGFQVITLTIFFALAIDYAVRYWKKHLKQQSTIPTSASSSLASPELATENSTPSNTAARPEASDNAAVQELAHGDDDNQHHSHPHHTHHDQNPLSIRQFQIFLLFLTLSAVCIFIRCCYRIAELKEGYKGDLFHDQATFIALESVMIVIASFALNVAQPGPALAKPALANEKRDDSDTDVAATPPTPVISD